MQMVLGWLLPLYSRVRVIRCHESRITHEDRIGYQKKGYTNCEISMEWIKDFNRQTKSKELYSRRQESYLSILMFSVREMMAPRVKMSTENTMPTLQSNLVHHILKLMTTRIFSSWTIRLTFCLLPESIWPFYTSFPDSKRKGPRSKEASWEMTCLR
ncbi:uncharacterized protein EV420DRAFT_1563561 [Desarmillaria tabescens]|uniref:Uncharacterized protein n=1 Tax=Armillaria tabescens TaxID=1929756 RepID=A0AA39JWZ4_ARMTA|nr:uncharacterized protein EV420DRAFT_1563561 [Desarmillaria tabescens]KAK0450445.1 hypothetical protein EV420DRAFT_1563561 [Desarmillaria tabescens]